MKKCSKCGSFKDLSMFNKDKYRPDGMTIYCKDCIKEYRTTESGVVSEIYSGQVSSSKTRGHNPPQYTKEWLTRFMYKNGFKKLYDSWVKSGHSKRLKPSIDRLDDYDHYTKNNIQLVTFGENNLRCASDVINGINTKTSKAVVQLTKSGEFVSEYHSQKEAERCTGIKSTGIGSCCIGKDKYKSAGGFCWKFKHDYYKEE